MIYDILTWIGEFTIVGMICFGLVYSVDWFNLNGKDDS